VVVCWPGANQWRSKGGYWWEQIPQRAGHGGATSHIKALYFKNLFSSKNLNQIILNDYFLKKSCKKFSKNYKNIRANVLFFRYSRFCAVFTIGAKFFSPFLLGHLSPLTVGSN